MAPADCNIPCQNRRLSLQPKKIADMIRIDKSSGVTRIRLTLKQMPPVTGVLLTSVISCSGQDHLRGYFRAVPNLRPSPPMHGKVSIQAPNGRGRKAGKNSQKGQARMNPVLSLTWIGNGPQGSSGEFLGGTQEGRVRKF